MNPSLEALLKEKFQNSNLTERFVFKHTFDNIPLVQRLIEAALKIKVEGLRFDVYGMDARLSR